VYYPPGARVAVRDSNFIFGATGSGQASLTISGAPVTVAPNGVPRLSAGPARRVYRLQAAKGTETAAMEQRVDVPRAGPRLRRTHHQHHPAGACSRGRRGVGERAQLARCAGGWCCRTARVPLVESGALRDRAADDFRAAPPPAGAPEHRLYQTVVPATMPWVRATRRGATAAGRDHRARSPSRCHLLATPEPKRGRAPDEGAGGAEPRASA
jgi:hypothetical protein